MHPLLSRIDYDRYKVMIRLDGDLYRVEVVHRDTEGVLVVGLGSKVRYAIQNMWSKYNALGNGKNH